MFGFEGFQKLEDVVDVRSGLSVVGQEPFATTVVVECGERFVDAEGESLAVFGAGKDERIAS